MKQIKMLAREIREELRGAERYAKLANEYKGEDRQLADMYYELARQELKHAGMEHDQATRLIKDSKDRGNVPTDAMMQMWEFEHEQDLEDEKAVNILLDMYKN